MLAVTLFKKIEFWKKLRHGWWTKRGVLPSSEGIVIHLFVANLTRFNKIATQGAPQMAVDKDANSLSRVYSYYSKFNLCLFYV